MDFDLSDEQQTVRDLATQIFEGHATVERVKEIEGGIERFDRALWAELAKANVLGLSLPEADGGSGFGIVEACLVLEQQGRRVAPVPLLPTVLTAALPIAEFGSNEQRRRWLPGVIAGDIVLTAALAETGANDPLRPSVVATERDGEWRLVGVKPTVPAAHLAARVLVPASTGEGATGVFLVDPADAGVELEAVHTTNRERQAHIRLSGAAGEPLGDPRGGSRIIPWIVDRTLVGLAAIQVGVAEEAVRLAATYTAERQQFGKPLATFQGVALKAADAYIDTQAMRATMLQAAWQLDEGLDATNETAVAKWWAAEGGQRVVHITQHLHGGMGADVDYPVHRYFLWGKQIETTLGGASAQLARLGAAIAAAGA